MNTETKKEVLSSSTTSSFETFISIHKRPLIKAIDMNDTKTVSYLVSKNIDLGKTYCINTCYRNGDEIMYISFSRWVEFKKVSSTSKYHHSSFCFSFNFL